jgi:hypothetical protein
VPRSAAEIDAPQGRTTSGSQCDQAAGCTATMQRTTRDLESRWSNDDGHFHVDRDDIAVLLRLVFVVYIKLRDLCSNTSIQYAINSVAKMLAIRFLEECEELMCIVREVMIVIAGCELRLPNRNPASLYEGHSGCLPICRCFLPKAAVLSSLMRFSLPPPTRTFHISLQCLQGDRSRKPRYPAFSVSRYDKSHVLSHLFSIRQHLPYLTKGICRAGTFNFQPHSAHPGKMLQGLFMF